jgi:hypothetical protein
MINKLLNLIFKKNLNESSLVQNINLDLANSNQKKVLISYINDSVFTNYSNNKIFHTNINEVNQILSVFIRKNYSIDIISAIDTKSIKFINNKKYDLIFGFGDVFHFFAKHNPNSIKILYMTENHPNLSYTRENERIDYFFERHRKRISIQRSFKYYKLNHFNYVDYSIILGEIEPFNKYLFPKYNLFPTGMINSSYVFKKREYPHTKKSFLWFGSTGAIHKGLDLLIDIFSNRQDITLYICGLQDHERKLLNIPKRSNIKDLGRVNIQSEEFKALVELCSFIILPSCSEGFSTSITTCMRHSLIPIIIKDTGFNRLEDNAIFIENFRIESIEYVINKVISFEDSQIDHLHTKIYLFANKFFTINNFTTNFNSIISDIEDNHESKR